MHSSPATWPTGSGVLQLPADVARSDGICTAGNGRSCSKQQRHELRITGPRRDLEARRTDAASPCGRSRPQSTPADYSLPSNFQGAFGPGWRFGDYRSDLRCVSVIGTRHLRIARSLPLGGRVCRIEPSILAQLIKSVFTNEQDYRLDLNVLDIHWNPLLRL
ncbi:MAG: hypothetical protein JWP89_649 [Schlesneria sp.]|nr:hypothetical protein [Schlesneria sp.]